MPGKAPQKAAHMKGRATLYKGISMRSRLEADFAASMDRSGCTWKYEPKCFASEQGQWLPDFQVWNSADLDGRGVLIELKPVSLVTPSRAGDDPFARVDKVLEQMSIAWSSDSEWPINLVFWTYGASQPDLMIQGRYGQPWTMSIPNCPIYPLWPGMSQANLIQAFEDTIAEMRVADAH